MADIQDLTSADFDQKVLEGSKTQPVVVDFWAAWCTPCKAMEPMFHAAADAYQGKATFYKLNVDDEPAISQRYGVMSIPTTIYFKDGRPMSQSIGLIDQSELEEHVNKMFA